MNVGLKNRTYFASCSVRVALRIDGDQNDLRPALRRQIGELLLDLCEQRQRRRAHVGTAREAEEQQTPASLQSCAVECSAVLIGERDGRQRARRRQDRARRQRGPLRRSREQCAREQETGAKGYNGDNGAECDRSNA